jgi:spore germination protein (amino acid permease)
MTVHNISAVEGIVLGTIMVCAKLFLESPQRLVELGGTAAWIIVLIGGIHGPISWGLIRPLLQRFPGKTLIGATEGILGPWAGTAVNLIYFAMFLILSSAVLREFGEAETSFFRIRTPLAFVVAVWLGTACYMAYLGIEALCRTATLGAPLMLITMVLLLIGAVLTHAERHALAPYWGTGPVRVISWGLVRDQLGDLLILGLLAPGFRRFKDLDRTVWTTVILSVLIMTATIIVILYVFPYPAAKRVNFPLLQVSRTISLGTGVQRVESLFFVIWEVGGVIKIAATLWAAAVSLAQIFGLHSYRQVLPALALLEFTMAMLPRTIMDAFAVDSFLRTYGLFVTAGLPALTLLVALIRRKGATAGAAG